MIAVSSEQLAVSSNGSENRGLLSNTLSVWWLVASCSLLNALCSPVASADDFKIGYVNLGRIFDGYQRTKDSEEILEQKGKQKQTELESRVNELTNLRKDVELLSDKARDSKAREIEEKSDSLQQLKTKSQRELVRERNQAAKQILDEIEQSVSEYAKTNGFSVILDQRSLLYGQDAYDVTDKVLRMLNDRYAATAKKAKHPN